MMTTTSTSTSSERTSSVSTRESARENAREGRRDAPRTSSRMSTTPPSATLDLRADDTAMGWIDGMAIGFHGFADENEAAHAAWVAYRTMSRRFAREGRLRPIPIDSVPLSLGWSGDAELIMAEGRPIASLVRPGTDSRSGPDSFGFELQMPMPTDALAVRSTAYLVYRTLRRSGIRWSMWTAEPEGTTVTTVDEATVDTAGADAATTRGDDHRRESESFARALSRHGASRAAAAEVRDDASGILGTLLVIVAMLAVVILPAITTSTVVPLLGGAAGLIALAALASLVHLVATDVRDRWRERPRPTREASATPRDTELPSAARVAA